jgi:hypothetical protein
MYATSAKKRIISERNLLGNNMIEALEVSPQNLANFVSLQASMSPSSVTSLFICPQYFASWASVLALPWLCCE